MRAHEAHAEGVAVSKGARVFTVFSTSKDHNQGSKAMAGCILVDFEKLQVINRSPAYKSKYVHRRDSVALAALSESEIQKRMRLGLVTSSSESVGGGEGSDEDEEWEDLEEQSDEEGIQYRLSESRRASVDLNGTVTDNGIAFEGSSTSSFSAHLDFAASNSMMDSDLDLDDDEPVGGKMIVDFEPNKRLRSRDGMERMDAIASGDEEGFDDDDDDDVEFDTGSGEQNKGEMS
jgi:hypothetical protein